MEVLGFLVPWILIGIGVVFVAFSGGPGRAREAYLTGGGRAFRLVVSLIYVGIGIAVPVLVIAGRGEAEGGKGRAREVHASAEVERGKELFRQTCASCHALAAVNASGVTGPDLDKLGGLNEQRVLSAIKVGGTGEKRMPAGLLEGENAEAVAAFLARTAQK